MEYDREALRTGQLLAIDTVIDRYRRGEPNAAIILPTRYGKSDVARVVTLYLWDEGEMPCALALSPSEYLRGQLASTKKWNEATRRYRIHTTQGPVIAVLERARVRPNQNGEMFLSATTHLVQRNLSIYEHWVESEVRRTGRRPSVWLDEAHLSSMGNEWGQIPVVLSQAGAFVVLMTATAERKDGERIPGFVWEPIDVEQVKVAKTHPDAQEGYVRVDLYEGQRTVNRLRAHHETPFSEAWKEDALCNISFHPFEVELSAIERGWSGVLSKLSPSKTREQLGKIVRHSTVTQEGVQRHLQELDRLRRILPDLGGIAFVGNDNDKDEPATNKDAERVREEYHRQQPGLDVVIATSAVEGAKEIVEAFAGGRHDVLIVKQMASLGVDIERLAVTLDLSPTRTYASYIQRLMRAATPYKGLLICSHVTPADVFSRAYFNKCVRDQGGEATISDLTLIDSYRKLREDAPKIVLTVDGVSDADFFDARGNQASGIYWPRTRRFMANLPPRLQQMASMAEVAQAYLQADIDEEAEGAASTVTDASVAAAGLRDEINDLANDFAKLYVFKRRGRYDRGLWVTTLKQLFSDAYANASGWPKKPNGQFEELTAVTDLTLLAQVRDYIGLAYQAEQG